MKNFENNFFSLKAFGLGIPTELSSIPKKAQLYRKGLVLVVTFNQNDLKYMSEKNDFLSGTV